MPQFGDTSANAADASILQAKYPNSTMVQLNIDDMETGYGDPLRRLGGTQVLELHLARTRRRPPEEDTAV